MLLYIHDCFETSSSFLTNIRTLLDLSIEQYDDKFILDTFCVKIPGYDKDDNEFSLEYILNKVQQLIIEKNPIQKKLASQLIVGNKAGSAINNLKNNTCTLVAHGSGCAIGLSIALNSNNIIDKLIMLDATSNYNNWKFRLEYHKAQNLLRTSNPKIETQILKAVDTDYKSFLSLLLKNSNQKGVQSYLEFTKNYDFENEYNTKSIDQKSNFAKIPILVINSNRSRYNARDINKLISIVNPKKNFLSKKHTIVMVNSITNIQHSVLKLKTKNILLDNRQDLIVEKIRDFLG